MTRTAWRRRGDGLSLSVRVTPKSGANAIDGLIARDNGQVSLRVRVTAQPEKGAANTAVIGLLAKVLGIARRDIVVTAGATSRAKTLAISGDPDHLARRLAALAGPDEA